MQCPKKDVDVQMKVEVLSNKFCKGQRAIIDKGKISGRHLKLRDGESMIYVESGLHCTVKDRLFGNIIIVEIDDGGWICEIDSKNLTRLFEPNNMKSVDEYISVGTVEDDF
jgi:hypothetical protein